MATVNPSWTDNVAVISAQNITRPSVARGTLDLRAKFGAFLLVSVGRRGTTALGTAVKAFARRTLNNDGAGGGHPAGTELTGTTTAAASTNVTGAGGTTSGRTLQVASDSGFAAGDLIVIQDADGGVTRLEWARVVRVFLVLTSVFLELDRNLQYEHTAGQSDHVRNKADVFAPVWLPGGAKYEVLIDHSGDTGENVVARAMAQTYDQDDVT